MSARPRLGGENCEFIPMDGMPVITYRREPVAVTGKQHVFIVPTIANRPDADPLKRFICHLIVYVRDAQSGRLAGEPHRYLPTRAESYVRARLIPAGPFHDLRELPELRLADIFGVPVEEIAERRLDLATTARMTPRFARQRGELCQEPRHGDSARR